MAKAYVEVHGWEQAIETLDAGYDTVWVDDAMYAGVIKAEEGQ